MITGSRFDIPSLCFQLEPLMNRVAANAEHLTDFTPFHPIQFDRFEYFAAQIIVVGFGYGGTQLVADTSTMS
jgi:hypothetical protein